MAKSKFRSHGNYREELKERTDETLSGNYTTIFKSDSNLPFWKDTEGDHALDIIPWLSSENHPNYKADKPVYKVEIWVHKRVGPEKGDYICLRNYGEDCPLCEARVEELSKESPRKKVADSLKGSQRCLYNVVVYTDNQEDRGVQVWEASSYLGESQFKDTAKNKRTGERIAYSDPDKGKTVTFTVAGKMTSKKITGIVFEDRPAPIDDEILDEAYVIEDYLIKPTPEELEKIAKAVLGGMDYDDDEPVPPKRTRRGQEDEEDAPPPRRRKAPPVEEEPEEEEPPPRRKKPAPKEEEPEEEEEAPPPRRRKAPPVEEEEEEAPPPRRKKPAPKEEPEDEPEEEDDAPPPTRRMRRR